MTVNSPDNKVQYVGNGTTRSFAFPFVFFTPTDLVVSLYDTAALAPVNPAPVLNGGGTYDYQVIGTQDPASGEYLSGAAILFNGAPLGNHQITGLRAIAVVQNSSYVDNGKFPAKSTEGSLDRLTMIDQQQDEMLGRALLAPPEDVNAAMVLPPAALRANLMLGFDGSGNPQLLPEAPFTAPQSAQFINYLPDFTGAVSHSVMNKLSGWISVFDFMTDAQIADVQSGAPALDMTAPIQAAINWILAAGVTNSVQGSPGNTLWFPAGTYRITSMLTFGPLALNNVGINLQGAGRGCCVLLGNVAGPVVAMDFTETSSRIDGFFVVNTSGSGNNCGVRARGNGQIITNMWFNCVDGILIETFTSGGNNIGASDIQISNILGDQCNRSGVHIADNSVGGSTGTPHTIAMSNIECFGGSQSNPFGIIVICSGTDITIDGLQCLTLAGGGVSVTGGATVTIDNYAFNNFGSGSATNRAITLTQGTINLGVGTITGWGAEGIHVEGNSTLFDNGAIISKCVANAAATNPYPVANIGGNYVKPTGSVAGGTGHELGLVFINGSANGVLVLGPGVILTNSEVGAVVALAGASPISSITIQGVTMTLLSQNGNAANVPIKLQGAVAAAQIADCVISVANPVTNPITNAVTVGTGTMNLSNMLANSGAFPATAAGLVSTNNRNF